MHTGANWFESGSPPGAVLGCRCHLTVGMRINPGSLPTEKSARHLWRSRFHAARRAGEPTASGCLPLLATWRRSRNALEVPSVARGVLDVVVIMRVRAEHMTQMPLAEHDHVIKALASDRANRSFGIAVCHGRSRQTDRARSPWQFRSDFRHG
jgi:hypothetical protein